MSSLDKISMTVKYREKIDAYRCTDCETDHFSQGDAEACCLSDRDRLLHRAREAGLAKPCRFIDVQDGSKKPVGHTKFELEEINGNYGVYAGNGLVCVDIDDYKDKYDKQSLTKLNELPETLVVETPSGGEHRYYKTEGLPEALEEAIGKQNPCPSWGEVRVHNQYVVGPGSELANGKGHYEIAEDRPIAELAADELVEVIVSDKKYSQSETEDKQGGDMSGLSPRSFEEDSRGARLEVALEEDPKLASLWQGDYSAYGGDRSEAECALAQKLAFWFEGDKAKVSNLMDKAGPEKWSSRGSDYKESVLEAVDKQTEFYSPSEGFAEDPQRYINVENKTITVGNEQTARELESRNLSGNASFADIVGELDGEYRDAFIDFWQSQDEDSEWNVKNDTLWTTLSVDSGTKQEVRLEVLRLLEQENSFVTPTDTEEILIYKAELGLYEEHGEQAIKQIIAKKMDNSLTSYDVNEILNDIRANSYTSREELNPDGKICLKNGILSLPEGDFEEHNPDKYFTRRVPVEYDPEATCEGFDAFLEDILAKQSDKRLVYQMFGYTLLPSYPLSKAFFFYGNGRNGKSTLLDVLRRFLGKGNISSRTLVEIEEDRFAASDLHRSMANIAGDLPNKGLSDTGMFKTLTGGDLVTADPKFGQPFSFENRAKLIFSANNPPAIADDSTALYRRLILLEFPNEFTPPAEPGPDRVPRDELMETLAKPSELSGILNEALSALQGLLSEGEFAKENGVDAVRNKHKTISEPVFAFVEECVDKTNSGATRTDTVIEAYNEWALDNDKEIFDKRQFGKKFTKHTGVTSKRVRRDGERIYVYPGVTLEE